MKIEQLEDRNLLTRLTILPEVRSDISGLEIPGWISQVQSSGDYNRDGIDDLLVVYNDLSATNLVYVYDIANGEVVDNVLTEYIASEEAEFGQTFDTPTEEVFVTQTYSIAVKTTAAVWQVLPHFNHRQNYVKWHDDFTDFNGDGIKDRIRNNSDHVEIIFGANPDIDGNGQVDFADFLILSENFGLLKAQYRDGDISGNGQVDFIDFLLLSNSFGQSL